MQEINFNKKKERKKEGKKERKKERKTKISQSKILKYILKITHLTGQRSGPHKRKKQRNPSGETSLLFDVM